MLYEKMIMAEFNVDAEIARQVVDWMSFGGFKFSSASKAQIIAEAHYAINFLGLI